MTRLKLWLKIAFCLPHRWTFVELLPGNIVHQRCLRCPSERHVYGK